MYPLSRNSHDHWVNDFYTRIEGDDLVEIFPEMLETDRADLGKAFQKIEKEKIADLIIEHIKERHEEKANQYARDRIADHGGPKNDDNS